jgi:eukaryotic-like serine/threonine-protein kinase
MADGEQINWYTGTIERLDDDTPTHVSGEPPSAANAPDPTQAVTAAGLRLVDEGEIARGGMGAVHRVHDVVILRHAAMKVLGGGRDHSDSRVRFLREAQITGQLDHPNIVPVYDLGTVSDGTLCFTMKLVRGQTLTELCRQRDVHPARWLEHILKIFVKVCDAVSFAHSRGVIHRDLKPDNIMTGTHGQVYVMDWGCAFVIDDAALRRLPGHDLVNRVRCRPDVAIDGHGTIIGTGAYMPPEQAWGRTDEIDARNDVFGLGAVLYEVITGGPPYRAPTPTEAVLLAQRGRVPQPAPVAAHVPRALCRIAMKAMAADRDARYQTVDELQAEVERVLAGGSWFASESFDPGQVIVAEGDAAASAYIITSGVCEVSKQEDGRRVVLRRLGPGDVFGETALFTSQPRTATVTALDRVDAMIVTRQALSDELSLDSWTGAFVRTLAERFRDLDGRLSEVRRVHGRTLVREQIENYLRDSGKADSDGALEATWSPIRARLTTEFGLTDAEIEELLAQSPDLGIDHARDMVVMAPRASRGSTPQTPATRR